jgi:hypothetical protein
MFDSSESLIPFREDEENLGGEGDLKKLLFNYSLEMVWINSAPWAEKREHGAMPFSLPRKKRLQTSFCTTIGGYG